MLSLTWVTLPDNQAKGTLPATQDYRHTSLPVDKDLEHITCWPERWRSSWTRRQLQAGWGDRRWAGEWTAADPVAALPVHLPSPVYPDQHQSAPAHPSAHCDRTLRILNYLVISIDWILWISSQVPSALTQGSKSPMSRGQYDDWNKQQLQNSIC